MREIGRKEEEGSKGFIILWMGIIEDVFQVEGKQCKDQETLKMRRRRSIPERGRCFTIEKATLSGPVAVDQERFVAAARNSVGKKRGRKTKETSQGTWLDEARTGSFRLCYAVPLAGKQKSGISGSWQSSKPTPWERDSWES